jgi:hypothetical protein
LLLDRAVLVLSLIAFATLWITRYQSLKPERRVY